MIYVNQAGYSKEGTKRATIAGTESFILHAQDGREVLKGECKLQFDENSGENAAVVDFSEIKEEGKYYFTDGNGEKSAEFVIAEDHYDKAFKDVMKMFYFQRCGMELEEKYAGKFARKACHCKGGYMLENKSIRRKMLGGWHDAGDYGRYVTAAAVALAHIFYGYEMFPYAFDKDLNIPESGGIYPDILAECKYELDWILDMQDEDGGVHHKCTSAGFCGFIMPEDDDLDMVITPVSSLATADFAAIMAQASRIYGAFDAEYGKTLADAARKAWEWLIKNPSFVFENPKEVTTGTYEDLCDADERFWAATEMYRLDRSEEAKKVIMCTMELRIPLFSLGWADVGGFGTLAVINGGEDLFGTDLYNRMKLKWMDEADRLKAVAENNAFGITLRTIEFTWGSNMVVLTNSMILAVAHFLTGDESYLKAAEYQLDYIFGRNAMDLSYVTGIGERAFKHPHLRPTEADGIDEAIPGFVSGGPNFRPCDEAANLDNMSDKPAMRRYADDMRSYSTNEITIYWNSPLVFMLGYIESLK
ncbi:glycoside hydrolase family 9 protein [Butyrivibrio sp. YAB3001]|uniref:glycoside hydrolase family 9 protein n=1 Tax=Butyrivibrio sp. YAB3001 TaxID=1520812 RepID=UPI0008F62872|nr:glycoside hydrolase family 9 protein [Butyrivibrio sp. YAB3001]SFC31391.1 endoglucanase [Butyrivibrio sp. YAB3001]